MQHGVDNIIKVANGKNRIVVDGTEAEILLWMMMMRSITELVVRIVVLLYKSIGSY